MPSTNSDSAPSGASEDFIVRELMKYRSRVWALAFSMTRDPHLAEDILQEVAILLLKKREDFDTEREFLPWALGFARRKSLEALRARTRAQSYLEDDVWIHVQERMEGTTPEATLQYIENRKLALKDCLSKVSDANRRVLLMKYVEGMSAKDISEKIERTSTATHSLLQRLRNQLQSCIERRFNLGGQP